MPNFEERAAYYRARATFAPNVGAAAIYFGLANLFLHLAIDFRGTKFIRNEEGLRLTHDVHQRRKSVILTSTLPETHHAELWSSDGDGTYGNSLKEKI